MSERTVQLSGVDEKEAAGLLQREGMVETSAEEVGKAIPQFIQMQFPKFRAEHANIDGDLVIHFFIPVNPEMVKRLPPRQIQQWESYWLESFPAALSPAAKEYFQADKPRILAKYTEEVASWWFVGRGFGDSLDLPALVRGFYERLSAELPPVPVQA